MRSELFQAAVDTLLTAISVEFARGPVPPVAGLLIYSAQ